MADAELSALTENTTPAFDDLVYVANNGGTTDRKVQVQNIRRSPATRLFLAANYV